MLGLLVIPLKLREGHHLSQVSLRLKLSDLVPRPAITVQEDRAMASLLEAPMVAISLATHQDRSTAIILGMQDLEPLGVTILTANGLGLLEDKGI